MYERTGSADFPCAFNDHERRAVYRAMNERRDMRHFAGGNVLSEVLLRLLQAAHHAPSVGFMQPWRFIRITQRALREQVHALVEHERQQMAAVLGTHGDELMKLKVEGALEAAQLLAFVLADARERHVFSRRAMPLMDLASAASVIQNLWLAAREGLGIRWVSLFEPEALAAVLHLPPGAMPIALLCLGPVGEFYSEPMLQREGWAKRQPLTDLVFDDCLGRASTLMSAEAAEADDHG